MRLPVIIIIAAALGVAAPAWAQTVDSLTGFNQAVAACVAITEADGAAPAIASAKKAAGLIDSPPEPQALDSYFFKDAAHVDWWRKPTSDGRVHIGFEPAKNQCRVFLLAAPRRDAIQRVWDALPQGWFAVEGGQKNWARRRTDGTLTVLTVLPGDESKGIGPTTLTAMANSWHNTAK